MSFEKGDRITVTKPNNLTEGAGWCRFMDPLTVGQHVVKEVLVNGDMFLEGSEYIVEAAWCRKVEPIVLFTWSGSNGVMGIIRCSLPEALGRATAWCYNPTHKALIYDNLTCELMFTYDVDGLHRVEKAPPSDRHKKVVSVTDES